jgi:hypothetical protein
MLGIAIAIAIVAVTVLMAKMCSEFDNIVFGKEG